MSTLVTTALRHNASASNNMVLDSNGRVGIGTATPDRILNVTGVNSTIGITATNGGSISIDAPISNLAQIDVAGANALRFNTNSNERMRIDALGRVTMPAQPLFHAFSSGMSNIGISGTNNLVVIPNTATTNIGSHYSTSTGRFTAPVAGTYCFYCQVPYVAVSGASYVGAAFRRNSSGLIDGYSSLNGYNQIKLQVVIALAVNDFVDVIANYQVTSGTIESGANGRLYFGGYLIG